MSGRVPHFSSPKRYAGIQDVWFTRFYLSRGKTRRSGTVNEKLRSLNFKPETLNCLLRPDTLNLKLPSQKLSDSSNTKFYTSFHKLLKDQVVNEWAKSLNLYIVSTRIDSVGQEDNAYITLGIDPKGCPGKSKVSKRLRRKSCSA